MGQILGSIEITDPGIYSTENNRIVISDKERLFSEGLMAKELNLMAVEKLDRPYKVKAKIRLKHREANATVFPHGHNVARIVFEEPQMSVTPGQSVTFSSIRAPAQ